MTSKHRNSMTENKIALPQPWCGPICSNAMSEMCIEHCAVKRDCSYFVPARGLTLANMPRFPDTKKMTREERFTSVAIYVAKVVDDLQGVDDEYITIRRPHTYSSPSSRLSSTVQVKDLLPDLTQAIPPPTTGEERESTGVRSEELAQPTD